jgi:hypothetical protein
VCSENRRETQQAEGNPLRFLLWIDGVGGYLVCLGARVTFGHVAAADRVDVPLAADVSRLHASLTRDAEGYVLEAVRPVEVNAATVTRALLQADDRVTLGTTCQFVFRRPAPVSATARLDLVSGHRVMLGVDGVLLMADLMVLGDGPQAHVYVPELRRPVVFYRHPSGLGLRHQGGLSVDGCPAPLRGLLPLPSRVAGEDVSFAVEPLR